MSADYYANKPVVPAINEFQGQYRWLSNFHIVPIEYKGFTYPSTEHAYMAQKSDDKSWKQFCANPLITPYVVKKESYKQQLVPDWDKIKNGIMLDVLRIKFQQPDLKAKLLSTGNALIEEGNTWGDVYWGVDKHTGRGMNYLGKLIMQVRQELKIAAKEN